MKTWEPETLVPRLGDLQEGKDERKRKMRESSIASTARQLSEVCRHQSGSPSHCPSSLVVIPSEDLLSGSSRFFEVPGTVGEPQLECPQEAVMQMVPDSLPAQQAQSFCSLFTQHRPLRHWVTWTCIHSEEHSMFSF